MRRRRTAAPSSLENTAEEIVQENAASLPADKASTKAAPAASTNTDSSTAPETESTAAPRRRRSSTSASSPDSTGTTSTRRRGKAAASAATEPAPEPVVAVAPEPQTPPAPVEEPPARPRRTSSRRRGKAAAEEETPVVAEEVLAPALLPVESVGAEEETPTPVSTVEVLDAPGIEEVVPETIETVGVEDTSSEEEDGGSASGGRNRGRRRRRGKRNGTSEGMPGGEAAEVASSPASAEETAGAAATTRRRTRGPARLAITPPSAEVTPAVPAPILPVAEAAAPLAEAATAAKAPPKRIRGPRARGKGVGVVQPGESVSSELPRETPALVPTEPGVATPTIVTVSGETVPAAYQPLPAETLARLPETRVVNQNGFPELLVNGEPRLPIWFFVNTEVAEEPEVGLEIARREIRQAYEAGVRFFSVLSHLPWKTRSGERRYDLLEDILSFVAENAPEALVLPRLIFSPPASWERNNPEEMTLYPDGETGDVSLASRAFWEGEAEGALRAAVEHVAEGPHAHRVFGFYLEHGEWFYEKGRGYDISEANQRGFRSWLKNRYKNNLIALRAAWQDGGVTFDTASVPAYPAPVGNTLFFSGRERRWADFHSYGSDAIAQVIVRLGRAVKEASGGRSAVAVSYGYALELTRNNSGHNSLRQILDSPDVDILTGPVSYGGRMPGGSAPLPAPVESIHLAGKLWVSEDDTKTFLARRETPDAYNPKVNTPEGTLSVHARNFGAALAHGAGISWMDLWGEGWLDNREIWEGLGRLIRVGEDIAARRREGTISYQEPDVAVIVDERSYAAVRQDEQVLGHLINYQRDALLRSGARIGFYLLSDLLRPDFPQKPKLLLFLNAFLLPTDIRVAIQERHATSGRTLAWLYGPGALEDGALSEWTDVIGMQLRLQPWGSKTGTQVTDGRSPLTEYVRGQRFGEEGRANPSFYVNDPKAQILGEYIQSGNPSLAVRRHTRWQSVFIGEMTLTVPLLRGLYRLAGVPIYTVDDDVAWVADSLVFLHSAPGGGTTLYLPDRAESGEEATIYDLLNQETLASGGYGARLSMPQRGTRLLFVGTAEEVNRLGGDPYAAQSGLFREELPTAPTSFAYEEATLPAVTSTLPPDLTDVTAIAAAAPAGVSPEDAALFAAALADMEGEEREAASPPAASTTTATAGTAEAEAEGRGRKRRRRRRGRGRNAGDLDSLGVFGEGEDGEEDEEELTTGLDPALTDSEEATPLAAPPSTTPGRRPSLEELLPLSDIPDGAELPPIPDEFLPLGDDELTRPAAGSAPALLEGTPEEEDATLFSNEEIVGDTETTTGRRRRNTGTGRLRRNAAGATAAGSAGTPPAAPTSRRRRTVPTTTTEEPDTQTEIVAPSEEEVITATPEQVEEPAATPAASEVRDEVDETAPEAVEATELVSSPASEEAELETTATSDEGTGSEPGAPYSES